MELSHFQLYQYLNTSLNLHYPILPSKCFILEYISVAVFIRHVIMNLPHDVFVLYCGPCFCGFPFQITTGFILTRLHYWKLCSKAVILLTYYHNMNLILTLKPPGNITNIFHTRCNMISICYLIISFTREKISVLFLSCKLFFYNTLAYVVNPLFPILW